MPVPAQGLPGYVTELGKALNRRADGSNEIQTDIGTGGRVLSVSSIVAQSTQITGSQSVFIVGQQVGATLSASLIHEISATVSNIQQVGQIIGDVRATNLGIRPLTSASDTVNVPTVTTVGRVVGDINATNFGIRPLRSDSDIVGVQNDASRALSASLIHPISVTFDGSESVVIVQQEGEHLSASLAYPVQSQQSGNWNIQNVAQVVGDIRGTNFGIRPLTSASDSVTAHQGGNWNIANVSQVQGDVRGTNFGIRPLTSNSDTVGAVQSGNWNVGINGMLSASLAYPATIRSGSVITDVASNQPDTTTTGSFTATSQNIDHILKNGETAIAVQITGTWTGIIGFQGSLDGTTFVTHHFIDDSDDEVVSAINSQNGLFVSGYAGIKYFRLTSTGSWTGTANISIRSTTGVQSVHLESPIPTGTNVIGSVRQSGIWSNSIAYPVTATVNTVTNVGQVIGDVRATNLGIRPLTSASDTVTASQGGTWNIANVSQIQGDVRATNLGTRPLTSASDSVAAIQSGTWNVANVSQVQGDVRGTNFGIRPLTSASDTVGVRNDVTTALSASLIHGVTANITGSQSVFIVGAKDGVTLSASLIHPITATVSTIENVAQIVGDIRATNLGMRPLRSDSDTVTVARVIGDINATNLGIRPLTSASDSVGAAQNGVWNVANVSQVIGDVRGTNFGIRPLTSASDAVKVPSASVFIVGIQDHVTLSASIIHPISATATVDTISNVQQIIGDIRATNLGIRPLRSDSDTVTVARVIGDIRGTNFGIRPLTSASDTVAAVGNIAHDAADSGNPLKIGMKSASTLATITPVANADRADGISDLDGVLITRNSAPLGDVISERVSDTAGNSTAFSNFGAVASTTNVIRGYSIANTSATNGYVDFRDGTSGAILWTVPIPANGGANLTIPDGIFKTSKNTALAYDVSAALTTVYISVTGYRSKI